LPIRPLIDHARFYTKDGKPYAVIFHPYTRLNLELTKAVVEWADRVGLDFSIDADSEYYPGVTLRIVLHRKGTTFPRTDLA
jgi:hypothetical protein